MELLSCFTSPPLVRVLHGQREIGFIDQISFVLRNDQKPVILLAGRGWQISHLDWDARVAYVTPTDLRGRSQWLGSSPPLSFELCQSIKHVIAGDRARPEWSRRADEGITQVRAEMPWCSDNSTAVISAGPNSSLWWTFAGLRANATLAGAFAALGIKAVAENFNVAVQASVSDMQAGLIDQARASATEQWPAALVSRALDDLKFSDCLPRTLAERLLKARLSDPSSVQRILGLDVRCSV